MKILILSSLFGSHLFLNAFPLWVYALIYAGFYSFLWIGRWAFEGRGYDVAYSSRFGDIALAIFVIIAANIIQQPNFYPANWMEGKNFHLIVGGISIITSIFYFFIGMAYTFHLIQTFKILKIKQPDIVGQGYLFCSL